MSLFDKDIYCSCDIFFCGDVFVNKKYLPLASSFLFFFLMAFNMLLSSMVLIVQNSLMIFHDITSLSKKKQKQKNKHYNLLQPYNNYLNTCNYKTKTNHYNISLMKLWDLLDLMIKWRNLQIQWQHANCVGEISRKGIGGSVNISF